MPSLRVDSADSTSAQLTFITASDGTQIDPASIQVTPAATVTPGPNDVFSISFSGLPSGKNHRDGHRERSPRTMRRAQRASRSGTKPRAWDWRDAVIYQVHRRSLSKRAGAARYAKRAVGFRGRNDRGAHGGSRRDRRARLQHALALAALREPDGHVPRKRRSPLQRVPRLLAHRLRARSIRAFGTESDVDALHRGRARARHARRSSTSCRNHVHKSTPTSRSTAPTWFTDGSENCVCGIGACDWGTHIQDCWFAPYLPSFDWHAQDVARHRRPTTSRGGSIASTPTAFASTPSR